MSSFKQRNNGGGGRPARGRGFDLWYYQERGDGRTYLRLAPLGLALLVVPMILSLVAITAFFLYRSHAPRKDPDITITPPPSPTEPTTKSVIKPVAAPPTPPPVRIERQIQTPVTPKASPSAGTSNTSQPPPRSSPTGTP